MKISIIKQLFFLTIIITCLILPQNSYAARLWSSGFELQSATTGVEWSGTTVGSPAIDTTTKRSGAASMRCNPSPAATAYVVNKYIGNNALADIFVRFYLNISTAPSAITQIAFLNDSAQGGSTLSIKLNTNRTLELWNEGGTPAQVDVDSSALSLATWYRIELAYDWTGADQNTVTAYIDNVQFATGTNLGGTSDNPNTLQLGVRTAVTADLYFDDVAVNDASGTSTQTGLPGTGSIVHLWPDSDGDYYTMGSSTPDSQPSWSVVDENPTPNDATDYWGLLANNDILDVNTQSSASAGINSYDNITLVQVGVRHALAVAGSSAVNLRVESQTTGTVASGSSFAPAATWQTNGVGSNIPTGYKLTSYTDPQDIHGVDPWTPALLDTMQIGAKATDANPDVWISTLWALVEYVPGTPPSGAAKWLVNLKGMILRIMGKTLNIGRR